MALRSLIMTAALMTGICAAQAADLPQRAPTPYRAPAVVAVPVYNWTGFYIGANGGYGWAGASASSGGLTVDGGDLKGPFAGGQIGFNYQSGMFVFGIEVDGQWANIKESYGAFGLTFTDTINYFFTARGRLGIAAQNVLFYGTGGYAHLGAKSEVTDGFTTISVSGDRGGWTAGGGAEVGFGNASVKLEYLYMQTFDKNETVFAIPVTWNVHVHTVKLGLNYRFGGGPVVARY
jgi:outer membrane immunogenic protein